MIDIESVVSRTAIWLFVCDFLTCVLKEFKIILDV